MSKKNSSSKQEERYTKMWASIEKKADALWQKAVLVGRREVTKDKENTPASQARLEEKLKRIYHQRFERKFYSMIKREGKKARSW